jgi:drug/metabolite transporter (DMT)-like permease
LTTALLAALLFGAAAPASKGLLEAFSPLQLAGIMYLGAALFALPFALPGGIKWPWTLGKVNTLRLVASLFFGGLLGPVLLLAGLQLASAGSVSMWLNLEVILTTVLACLLFQEHLSRRGWLAAGGGVLAALVLSGGEGQAGLAAGALVALACLCWAIDNNCTATLDQITPPQMVLWKGATAGSANLTLGLLTHSAPDWQAVPLALLIGALCFGSSIVLYISAAQQLGAGRSQVVFAAAPFFGLALSAVFLGEGITPLQACAAALMVAVIALLVSDEHEHEHAHEALTHVHEHSHDDGHHDHDHGEGFDPKTRHTHEHAHQAATHSHAHVSDLHHRHGH